MKHQIAFVGGQMLPVYLGIKEFNPDKVYLIVSADSRNRTQSLKSNLPERAVVEIICDPYNFNDVKSTCQKIISKIDESDQISINLTGGTKIMVLAGQSLLQTDKVTGFYINQNDAVLHLPSYTESNLTSNLTIQEFLMLTGHEFIKNKLMTDIQMSDIKVAGDIFSFCVNDYRYKKLIGEISKIYKEGKLPIPEVGALTVGKTEIKWQLDRVLITEKSKTLYSFRSQSIKQIFFNSGWWELVVANEVSKWGKAKEIFINSELPFKGDKANLKNEIDILVNLGKKLVFIECKSGRVKQDDINKIQVIRETYGGIISKSILVCVEMPYPNIIEKCKELNIEIFSCYVGKIPVNAIGKIVQCLDDLQKRYNL